MTMDVGNEMILYFSLLPDGSIRSLTSYTGSSVRSNPSYDDGGASSFDVLSCLSRRPRGVLSVRPFPSAKTLMMIELSVCHATYHAKLRELLRRDGRSSEETSLTPYRALTLASWCC